MRVVRRDASTPTRCCSPAWRSSAATSRSCSRSSPRRSRSARGCCRPTRGSTRFFELVTLETRPDRSARVVHGRRARAARRSPSTSGASTDFGELDYAQHDAAGSSPASRSTALGFQTILSSFFVSILGMRRREAHGRHPPSRAAEFDAYADDYDDALAARRPALRRGQRLLRARAASTGSGAASTQLGRCRPDACSTSAAAPAPRRRSCSALPGARARDRHGRLQRVCSRRRGATHGSDRVPRSSTLDERRPGRRRPRLLQRRLPPHPARRARRRRRARSGDALRPGGLFAFWENNPWNPGTRLVMSRIPFDRDAITLSALERGGCSRPAASRSCAPTSCSSSRSVLAPLRGSSRRWRRRRWARSTWSWREN